MTLTDGRHTKCQRLQQSWGLETWIRDGNTNATGTERLGKIQSELVTN